MIRPPSIREPRLLVTVVMLTLALFSPGAARGAPPPASRPEVEAVVRRLEAATNARDLAAAMALFALPDTAATAEKRQEFTDLFGLDSLACTTRVGGVEERAGRSEAAVYRQVTYRENGRLQARVDWYTMTLARLPGGWKIVADESRPYAHTRFTDLAVALDPDSGTMRGTAVLEIEARLPGADELVIGLNRGLAVESADDGHGGSVPVVRLADVLLVPLPSPLVPRDSLRLRLRFGGRLFNESQEQGYSQVSIAPAGSFASWVTSWYPNLQGPGGKSRGRIALTVPAALSVTASGRLVDERREGALERRVFSVTSPVKFSFAAARYAHRERIVDGIPLGVYFLQGGEQKADLYLAQTARVLRFLRAYYGLYPYDGFRIVEIPRVAAGSLGGSSEQGMSLFTEGGLPADHFPLPLVAHEMGHSWWGNLVPSSSVLVEEGLAQVSAALTVRALEGEPAMRRFLSYGLLGYSQCAQEYFREFALVPGRDLPLGVTRVGAAEGSLLHDLADTKGYFVFDMLREEIGDRAFQAGLRGAIARFASKTMSLRDLEAEWERASGRKLGRFFDEWVYRSGAPELALKDTVVARAGRYVVRGTIAQKRDLYHVTVEVVAVLPQSRQVERIAVSERETPFSFTVSAAPRAVLLDPQYRLLRWTGDFKNLAVLVHCQRLRSLGRLAEATASLDSCLRSDPDAARCRVELGICERQQGHLEEAERAFRVVAEACRVDPVYDPAAATAMLQLGQVCDLTGRRDEALTWYRQVLALPAEEPLRAEAEKAIRAPYTPTTLPALEVLRKYEGTYAVAGMGDYRVAISENGVLTFSGPRVAETGLEWIEGALFVLPARDDVRIEFSDERDGRASRMIVHFGPVNIPGVRKQP